MTDQKLKEIGLRIVKVRKRKNITQEQLAERLGVSVKFLSEVERGGRKFSVANYIKVANELGSSLDYILLGETQKELAGDIQRKLQCLSPEKQEIFLDIISKIEDFAK